MRRHCILNINGTCLLVPNKEKALQLVEILDGCWPCQVTHKVDDNGNSYAVIEGAHFSIGAANMSGIGLHIEFVPADIKIIGCEETKPLLSDFEHLLERDDQLRSEITQLVMKRVGQLKNNGDECV